MMQAPKPRSGSSEAPQRVSPRAVRQLKAATLESNSAASSNQSIRTPKDRSCKAIERKSPRSPIPEKKRPSKISELETQVSRLQEELKKTKNQLTSSESLNKKARQDAEESKKQLLALTSKLEDSEKQLSDLSISEEARFAELEEKDLAWQFELDTVKKNHSVNSSASDSTLNVIDQRKNAEPANTELHSLKEQLAETLSRVENMKTQLKDCKESEAKAQALVSETLRQLETAKRTVEVLRAEGIKVKETYNSVASELEQSRTRASLLRGIVNTDNLGFSNASNDTAQIHGVGSENEMGVEEKQNLADSENLQEADIKELKANLMDKETELQGIAEENEGLNMKLRKSPSCHQKSEVEHEFNKLREDVTDLKASLMAKEMEMQSVLDENKMLRLEVKKREVDQGAAKDNVVSELEAARAAEQEAVMKLGIVMEEADKSNRRAKRIAEQLETTRAASCEMEAELRRLKVQSEQWRKAAETAAAMISPGNNGKFVESTGFLDNNYSPDKLCTPYSKDIDDDLLKKKNGNMLKKIGVLWKKPQS